MQRKWFKAHTYGYGWSPATWQGWVVLGIYSFLMIGSFWDSMTRFHTTKEFLALWLPEVVLYTLFLLFITYQTGEKASWRWGKSKN